jgi:hypothetical protein
MTDKTIKPVTGLHHFHKVNPQGDTLYSVREGVPLGNAFDHLTSLLAAAQAGVENIAICDDVERVPGAAWGVYHLLGFAFELTQAMHHGIGNHERALIAAAGTASATVEG